jgi:hypothetical protein
MSGKPKLQAHLGSRFAGPIEVMLRLSDPDQDGPAGAQDAMIEGGKAGLEQPSRQGHGPR